MPCAAATNNIQIVSICALVLSSSSSCCNYTHKLNIDTAGLTGADMSTGDQGGQYKNLMYRKYYNFFGGDCRSCCCPKVARRYGAITFSNDGPSCLCHDQRGLTQMVAARCIYDSTHANLDHHVGVG